MKKLARCISVILLLGAACASICHIMTKIKAKREYTSRVFTHEFSNDGPTSVVVILDND